MNEMGSSTNYALGIKRFKQLRAIIKSLKGGVSISQACKAANIEAVTLWRWRQKSTKLDDLIYSIIDSRIQVAEDSLFNQVVKGNVKAAEVFLYNRAPGRWKNNTAINNTIYNLNKNKDEESVDRFKGAPRIVFTDNA